MSEEIARNFPLRFTNENDKLIFFEAVPLQDEQPNSTGVFIFAEKVEAMKIRQRIGPEINNLGVYFLVEKHHIENMIEKFRKRGANYLYFRNCREM